MNSILQALRNVPDLWCTANWQSDIVNAFTFIMSLMTNSDVRAVVPDVFMEHLQGFMPNDFDVNAQHDVPEVLQALLMEFVESRFIDGNQITLQCSNVLQCSSTKTEAHSILPVAIASSAQASMNAFLQPEVLEKEDGWCCSQCDKKQKTFKTNFISCVPNVLFLQVKRYSSNNCGCVCERLHKR